MKHSRSLNRFLTWMFLTACIAPAMSEVPYRLYNGEVADADKVMANFEYLIELYESIAPDDAGNVMIGQFAGGNLTTDPDAYYQARDNIGIGSRALYDTYGVRDNIAIGRFALISLGGQQDGNIAIGNGANVAEGVSEAVSINNANCGPSGATCIGGLKVVDNEMTVGGIRYPSTDGVSGQILKTDGNGKLVWTGSVIGEGCAKDQRIIWNGSDWECTGGSVEIVTNDCLEDECTVSCPAGRQLMVGGCASEGGPIDANHPRSTTEWRCLSVARNGLTERVRAYAICN